MTTRSALERRKCSLVVLGARDSGRSGCSCGIEYRGVDLLRGSFADVVWVMNPWRREAKGQQSCLWKNVSSSGCLSWLWLLMR